MCFKFNYLSLINEKKNILICPLDWGLGHATRCVPIIKELQCLQHNVIIGASANPMKFLKHEFPELIFVDIPGYQVKYSRKGNFLKLLVESIQFYKSINKEQLLVEKIVKAYNIDVIISDNRYGLWSDDVKSIIITHQLFIKAPLLRNLLHKKTADLISRFNECWIPDLKGSVNLSGELSHLKKWEYSHQFIGPLSRFNKIEKTKIDYDVLVIISGPEPQRTIFEKLILIQLKKSNLIAAVVSGNPDILEEYNNKNVTVFSHLLSQDFQKLINRSEVVICRSGYSSIMDLIILQKKAILIPTPGQTEQEYLAKYHLEQGNFYYQKQNNFNLIESLKKVELYFPKIEVKEVLSLDFLHF